MAADDQHDDAGVAAFAHLQWSSSIADLVTAFFDVVDDAWLDAACQTPSGRVVNVGIIEDAAFWHRAQRRIAMRVAGGDRRA